MSEEPTPVLEEGALDTPVEATPAGGSDSVDYRQRYDDIVPEFTRKSQRLSAIEDAVQGLQSDDPDTRQQAAQALGLQLADDEDTSLYDDDPNAELAARLARMEAQYQSDQQSRHAEQAQQRDLEVIGEGLRDLQTSLGRDLTMKEIGLLGDAAMGNRDEHGLPNIAHVTGLFGEVLDTIVPKRQQRPRAPHVSPAGAQAEHASSLDPHASHTDRVKAMVEALQANEL